VDYPGWDNDCACQTGLWGTCDATGSRSIHAPLAEELLRQSVTVMFQKQVQAADLGGAFQSKLNSSLPDSQLRLGIDNRTE
jgi:hypothetical protein